MWRVTIQLITEFRQLMKGNKKKQAHVTWKPTVVYTIKQPSYASPVPLSMGGLPYLSAVRFFWKLKHLAHRPRIGTDDSWGRCDWLWCGLHFPRAFAWWFVKAKAEVRPGCILLSSKFYYNCCNNNNRSRVINFSSFKLAMGKCSFFFFLPTRHCIFLLTALPIPPPPSCLCDVGGHGGEWPGED